MAVEALKPALDICEKLTELRKANFERIEKLAGPNGERFDVGKPIPGIDRSLSDIDANIIGLIDFIIGLNDSKDVRLVPALYFTELQTSVAQMADAQAGLQKEFIALDQNGGAGVLNMDDFTVQSQNSSQSLNVGQIFGQFSVCTDAALHHYYQLSAVLRGKKYIDFSTAFATFSKQLEELRRSTGELKDIVKGANAEQANIITLHEESTSLIAEINRLKTEGEGDRKTISEYAGESAQKVAAVRETASEAETLKQSVQGYQVQLDNFKAQLEDREKAFTKGQAEQDRLIEKLKEIEGEINRLITQSEDMLKGATVAGLASSFGESRDKLKTELIGARRIFYFAIFLFFVSALPLMAYVLPIPGISPLASADVAVSAPQLIGQIIVRAILLLPAA